MAKFCANCGKEINENADICLGCGKAVNNNVAQATADPNAKSKLVAGLLALFVGSMGIHNFYLGYTGKAIAQLLLFIFGIILTILIIGIFMLSAVGIWAFVEAILIFTGKIDKDGKGVPLIN